ncbi:hypothetical protein EOA35_36355 [Mesorhizobium sp. M8A.F.Ca.ET.023.01.1.1]|nr:hypothetical protein EOA35_36355 [Mesorhizobium sp. M8A.F.Ca.ET.023.01.1.1]
MLRVHFVISGECWLRPQGRPPLKLVKGDAALLPGGASHIVSDHRAAAHAPCRISRVKRSATTSIG